MTAQVDAPFNFEVERTILKYDFNDLFKLSIGRYHTPVNYWNVAFHHGQWLQTSIARPEITKFGGKLIPVHFVGGLVEGSIPAMGLNLNYNLGMGNGRSQVISRAGDAGDANLSPAWLLGLFVKPDFLYDLQVGGAIYWDKMTKDKPKPVIPATPAVAAPAAGTPVAPAAATTKAFDLKHDIDPKSTATNHDELITSAHIVWAKETPEFIAEFTNITHAHDDKSITNNWGYYVQVGYRLPILDARLKPYVRWEDIKIDPKDDSFTKESLTSFSKLNVGLRWDISDLVATKLEYQLTKEGTATSFTHGLVSQTSWTF